MKSPMLTSRKPIKKYITDGGMEIDPQFTPEDGDEIFHLGLSSFAAASGQGHEGFLPVEWGMSFNRPICQLFFRAASPTLFQIAATGVGRDLEM